VISVRYDEETGCSVVSQSDIAAPEGELLANLGAA
jgi:hypothetical protein